MHKHQLTHRKFNAENYKPRRGSELEMYSRDAASNRFYAPYYRDEDYYVKNTKEDNDDRKSSEEIWLVDPRPSVRNDGLLNTSYFYYRKNGRSDTKYCQYDNYFTQSRGELEMLQNNFEREVYTSECHEPGYTFTQPQMYFYVTPDYQHELGRRVLNYPRGCNDYVPNYQRGYNHRISDYQRGHYFQYVQPQTRSHDTKNFPFIKAKSNSVRHCETSYEQTHTGDEQKHCEYKGDKDLVMITHVVSPTKFYARYVKDNFIFKNISEQLMMTPQYCQYVGSVNKIGFMVAVLVDKSKYYRGVIEKINEATYEIQLIDRGDKIELQKTACYTVPRELMTIPGLAILCSFTNVDYSRENWSATDLKEIKNMLRGDIFRMNIVKNDKMIFEVELYFNDGVRVFDVLRVIIHGTDIVIPNAKRNRFLEPDKFISNNKYNVKVLHVNNVGNFYVQKCDDDGKESDELNAHIYHYFEILKQRKLVYTPYIGMPVMFNESNRRFYRAKILAIGEGKLCEKTFILLLVDLGQERRVKWKSICRMPPDLFRFPPEAIRCRLAGVSPMEGNDWSNESTDFLNKFNFDKEILKLESENNCDDVQNVVLFSGGLCINLYLVKQRMVVEDAVNSSAIMTKYMDKLAQQAERNQTEVGIKKRTNDEIERRIMVRVMQCESPGNMRLLYSSDFEKYQEYMHSIRRFYNIMNETPPAEDFDFETLYAVKIQYKWYRAKFVEDISETEIVVLLVDSNEKQTVSKGDVFRLDPQFETIDYSVHTCHLDGIVPPGAHKSWQHTIRDRFREELENHTKIYIELKGDVINDSQPVELFYIKRTCVPDPPYKVYKWTSFNKWLREEGLASYTQQKRLENVTSLVKCDEMKVNDDVAVAKTELENASRLDDDKSDTDGITPDKNDADDKITSVVGISVFPSSESKNLIFTDNWLQPMKLQQNRLLALITSVNDDLDLFTQNVDDVPRLDDMNDILQKVYANSPYTSDDECYVVHQLCIAKFPANQKWYRARVLEVYASIAQAKVEYVDYGNDEIVNFKDMRSNIIMDEFPIYCYRIKTSKVKPVNSRWSDEELTEIHRTIVDKEFIIVLKKDIEHSDYYQADLVIDTNGYYELFDHIVTYRKFARYRDEQDEAHDDQPNDVQLDANRRNNNVQLDEQLKVDRSDDDQLNDITNNEHQPNDVTNDDDRPNDVTNDDDQPNDVTNDDDQPNDVTNDDDQPNDVQLDENRRNNNVHFDDEQLKTDRSDDDQSNDDTTSAVKVPSKLYSVKQSVASTASSKFAIDDGYVINYAKDDRNTSSDCSLARKKLAAGEMFPITIRSVPNMYTDDDDDHDVYFDAVE